jgi:peptidoglycan/LPS O-acetylase OafA/YrhL
MNTKTHARIIRLEAGRGIAALIVVFGHILKTFAPQAIEAVDGSVLLAFINGSAAVMFFFVLSGFVLTVRFFHNPSAGAIAAAAIKRLPRLAFLTTIVALSSALLWKLGLYRFGLPGQLRPDFQPSFFAALKEGAWGTFMAGSATYDRPLWTMVLEFRGSLLVFLIASFLIFVLKRQFAGAIIAFAIVFFHYANWFMMFFICGMAIAYCEATLRRIARGPLTTALLLGGFFLFSYRLRDGETPSNFLTFAWLAGASTLVIAILQSRMADRILNNSIGMALGFLSFPIYLVHEPIIWSIGGAVQWFSNSVVAASMAVIAATLAISWPLGLLDRMWVRFISMNTARLVDTPPGRRRAKANAIRSGNGESAP